MSIVVSDRPSVSAAVLTRSRFAGPAVLLGRAHAAGRNLRAAVTPAQNADVATGRRGQENAADIVPERVTVRFGDIEVSPEEPGDGTLGRLAAVMRQDEVDIGVTLGIGGAEATVYGCDLSAGYVRVNADYTT